MKQDRESSPEAFLELEGSVFVCIRSQGSCLLPPVVSPRGAIFYRFLVIRPTRISGFSPGSVFAS